jgi:hypothetical protein
MAAIPALGDIRRGRRYRAPMDNISDQERLCRQYGAEWTPPLPDLKVGIAKNVLDGLLPINGLRHPPIADTTGWYIWAGDTLSAEDDFFVPLHVSHVPEWCPSALRFLGLPPGWRFLTAPGHEDAWFDPELLKVR